jgi:putative chitinase
MSKIEEALHYLKLAEECLQEEQEPEAPLIIVPAAPKPKVGLQKPDAFYDYIRGDVGELFPKMSDDQFKGIQADLIAAEGVLPLGWCAYCLATDYHETGTRMQGVREGFDVSDDWRRAHLRYFPWYGRGKVQLTWERNYKLATEKLKAAGFNVDLIANPDQALDLNVAAFILVHGMVEGWFTGKKLRDFLPQHPTRDQYKNARQIINGHDRDLLIAGYAVAFEEALKRGEWL